MTALARQSCMRPGQGEAAEVMVEIRVMPIGGVMAGGTICTVLTVMFIILLVAGDTIHRRTLELVVHMAGLTSHVCVLAFQFERSQIVVESGRRPAIHRVAPAAIQPEAALMWLIVMMTGVAILQGHLEVAKAARVDMTLHTGKTHVLTRQR